MQFWLVCLVIFISTLFSANALQCYSCRGTAPNEVAANIRCLENSYLEDCDDFYTYYSEVEDQNVLSYEYYYYEKPTEPPVNVKKTRTKSRDRDGKPRSRKRPIVKEGKLEQERKRTKRQTRRGLDKAVHGNNEVNNVRSGDDKDVASDYYDYYYGDYNYTYDQTNPVQETDSPVVDIPIDDVTDDTGNDAVDEEPLSLPKDPEHHCYSRTVKKSWESYTIEKGCKKIAYCKSLTENNPDWTHPWNFCCDKTRCNAKLVKDKPQRIFGMGCRQTDDCIQGMTQRPVCPNWFQSCPKISSSMVKMECRAKTRSNKNKYNYAFKEKKCYCSQGYHPKGPICTSGADHAIYNMGIFLATVTAWRCGNNL